MQAADLKHALRAIYEEIAEFHWDYPLAAVPGAGAKDSLHYYWYKYSPTPPHRSARRLDENGIARSWARTSGTVYRPAYIAMYGLHHLEKYLRGEGSENLSVFLKQADWLERHAEVHKSGAVMWPHNFDLWEGHRLLTAPWLSSNAQGLAMSTLVRAWRVTRRPYLLELLRGSTRVFQLDSARNGLRVCSEGHVIYAERPGFPAPGIMDGFMTSLLGLYDVYVETNDATTGRLFEEGIEGLKHFLPKWDYRRKWSFYSNRSYLCSPSYHSLNRILLSILARLTGESSLKEYADAWDPAKLSPMDRAEIYWGFLLTKNMRRLKCRTWRHKTATISRFEPEALAARIAS